MLLLVGLYFYLYRNKQVNYLQLTGPNVLSNLFLAVVTLKHGGGNVSQSLMIDPVQDWSRFRPRAA